MFHDSSHYILCTAMSMVGNITWGRSYCAISLPVKQGGLIVTFYILLPSTKVGPLSICSFVFLLYCHQPNPNTYGYLRNGLNEKLLDSIPLVRVKSRICDISILHHCGIGIRTFLLLTQRINAQNVWAALAQVCALQILFWVLWYVASLLTLRGL